MIEMCPLSVVVKVVSISHFRIPFQNHWPAFKTDICRRSMVDILPIRRQIVIKLGMGERGLHEGLAHFHWKIKTNKIGKIHRHC